jgi:hypothetical protein
MAKQISGGRKFLYYLGGLLMLVGLLSFMYTFVAFFGLMDDHGIGSSQTQGKTVFGYAFGGMALLIVGGIIRGMGALGLAGSGVVLDPERAREEVEPYSRMAGGVVKDVLDEADINLGGLAGQASSSDKVVMVRCQACRTLNEEDSKFCQECGNRI